MLFSVVCFCVVRNDVGWSAILFDRPATAFHWRYPKTRRRTWYPLLKKHTTVRKIKYTNNYLKINSIYFLFCCFWWFCICFWLAKFCFRRFSFCRFCNFLWHRWRESEVTKSTKRKSAKTKFRSPETNTKPSKTTKQKINRVDLCNYVFCFSGHGYQVRSILWFGHWPFLTIWMLFVCSTPNTIIAARWKN